MSLPRRHGPQPDAIIASRIAALEDEPSGETSSPSSLQTLLKAVPRSYIEHVLAELAPQVVAGINSTSIVTTRDVPSVDLPKTKLVEFDSSRVSHDALPPDCLLAFIFPPSPCCPSRLLVPAHSIVYSLASPLLPLLSPLTDTAASHPIPNQASQGKPILLKLPVIGPLALPSYAAFVALHSYLHLRSSARLLETLILPNSAFSAPPSPPPSPTFRPPPAYPSRSDRSASQWIQEVRLTAETLEISDEIFFKTVQRAADLVSGPGKASDILQIGKESPSLKGRDSK